MFVNEGKKKSVSTKWITWWQRIGWCSPVYVCVCEYVCVRCLFIKAEGYALRNEPVTGRYKRTLTQIVRRRLEISAVRAVGYPWMCMDQTFLDVCVYALHVLGFSSLESLCRSWISHCLLYDYVGYVEHMQAFYIRVNCEFWDCHSDSPIFLVRHEWCNQNLLSKLWNAKWMIMMSKDHFLLHFRWIEEMPFIFDGNCQAYSCVRVHRQLRTFPVPTTYRRFKTPATCIRAHITLSHAYKYKSSTQAWPREHACLYEWKYTQTSQPTREPCSHPQSKHDQRQPSFYIVHYPLTDVPVVLRYSTIFHILLSVAYNIIFLLRNIFSAVLPAQLKPKFNKNHWNCVCVCTQLT